MTTQQDAGSSAAFSACTASSDVAAGFPELDVRGIPLEQRCPAITAALEALAPGEGLTIVTRHNPLPRMQLALGPMLATQVQLRSIAACPSCWRLSLVRV